MMMRIQKRGIEPMSIKTTESGFYTEADLSKIIRDAFQEVMMTFMESEDSQNDSNAMTAVADKKIIEVAINELTAITGQKAVATMSRKDISNFKLRKKMPIGVRVTLRREKMYEFLERLIRVSLPRIRDFKGIESKFDGMGNYTLGIEEQIIFPEINIDSIQKILGMNITFVTSAKTDEEGYALLKEFGLPFKNIKK